MITVWPSARVMRSPTSRPSASVGPPGGNGTTNVTGREGNGSAEASGANSNARNARTRDRAVMKYSREEYAGHTPELPPD